MRPNGQITGQAEPSPLELASRNSTSWRSEGKFTETPGGETPDSSFSEKQKVMGARGTGKRVAFKLVNGALWGTISGVASAFPVSEGGIVGAANFMMAAYSVGVAIGVRRGDPHGRFLDDRIIPPLAGSVGGLVMATKILGLYPYESSTWSGWRWLPLLILPIAGATTASEFDRWRHPSESRFSIGLLQTRRRYQSVIATLHF